MINHLVLAVTVAALIGGCGESPAAEHSARTGPPRPPARIGTIAGARVDGV